MKYKYTIWGVSLCLLAALESKAQLDTYDGTMLVKSGATIYVDGLALTPSMDLTMTDNSFARIADAIKGSPNNSINRIYTIVTPIIFTGKIGMRYSVSELNGNSEGLIQFSFYGPKGWSIPATTGFVNVNTHYLEEDVVNQELFSVTATTNGSALPVMLIDFTTISNETSTLLSWSTSEETRSAYFEIQHSVNGRDWNAIGQVRANGESNVVKTYTFEHDRPAEGVNFYRLKMVDRDETFAYSRMRNIHFKGGSLLTLHPNPVADWLTIDASDWDSFTNLKITNVAGSKVGEFNENQLQEMSGRDINVQDFPSGIYVISITKKDGSVQSEKIFKN